MRGEEGVKAEEVVRKLLQQYPQLLKELEEVADETERYATLVAWMNKAFEEGGIGFIVVTGGFAVEIYTGRIYRTMDVDVICSNLTTAKALEDFLKGVGERVGRGYLPKHPLHLKSIDIVANYYDRSVPPVKLWVRGLPLYLDPPEYLITTYLAGWKFWESSEDRDKALWLLVALRDVIDRNLLKNLARRGGVEDALKELEKLAEKVLTSDRQEH